MLLLVKLFHDAVVVIWIACRPLALVVMLLLSNRNDDAVVSRTAVLT